MIKKCTRGRLCISDVELSVLCENLGMATGHDLGLEGDPVGQCLLVCEAPDLKDEALGYVLVHDVKVE